MESRARIWSWVVSAIVLLLVVVIAIILSSSPGKTHFQLGYTGYAPSGEFEGEIAAQFWATNSSSRAVMIRVTCIETNVLDQWYSYATNNSDWLPPWGWIHVDGAQHREFHLTPPSGVTTWRARFTTSTELKGWEVYWWYMKACGSQILQGYPLPQFPKGQSKVFAQSADVIGPVVSPK